MASGLGCAEAGTDVARSAAKAAPAVKARKLGRMADMMFSPRPMIEAAKLRASASAVLQAHPFRLSESRNFAPPCLKSPSFFCDDMKVYTETPAQVA
jgi:hypothetical protein